MNIDALRRKETRFVIGLVSDPACEGVDAALVRLKGSGPSLQVKFIAHELRPYSPGLRTRLSGTRLGLRELALTHFDLGDAFAAAAQMMMKHADDEGVKPDIVGSLGHNSAHVPPRGEGEPGELNLAESAVIAEQTGLPVVDQFSARDMAAGGQGAPMQAYAEWALFHRTERTSLILHLGGLAHMTVVEPALDNVISFHTGPGMAAIDGVVQLMTGGTHSGDPSGKLASRGVVIDELLDLLLESPFLSRVPPKSTGRNEFGPEAYLRDAIMERKDRMHSMEDFCATVSTAVAFSIIRAYARFVKPRHSIDRVIFSGAGVKHTPLVESIKKGLPGMVFRTSLDYGLPTGAIAAVSAAILANEFVCGTPANAPSATYARHPVILGKLTP